MDPSTALDRADLQFADVLAQVAADQWDLVTPCEKWPVSTLVKHVVGGHRMAVAVLRGGSAQEGIEALRVSSLGDEPGAVWSAACDELRAALASDPDLTRVVRHPAGDMPAAMLLEFRISDSLVHAWDLARAIGADDTLDPDVLAHVWVGLEPMAPGLASTGMFGQGPSGALGPDATVQARVLDALGRRP